jgi:hypothetical protein
MPESSPNRGVMIVLAYLWPLALIPLLLEKDDGDVRWHARHGLALMAAEIVVLIAFAVFTSLVSLATFGLGCALSVFVIFIWVAILAVHSIAIVKGLAGSRLIVPYISAFADRF